MTFTPYPGFDPSDGIDPRITQSPDNPCAITADLARVKATFQLRTIAAHMGFGPTSVHSDHDGEVSRG